MRLINVNTGRLEEFQGDKPPYAILSHTWGPDIEEILFTDLQGCRTSKPGFGSVKFSGLLEQAKVAGLNYAWMDTCCIDKANSNEVSEAINSMFRWYQEASVCCVILSDVPSRDDPDWKSAFRTSRWFSRGWTLQELLAPHKLVFYSKNWEPMGTKSQLAVTIKEITSIPLRFLLGTAALHEASVAQRMSWAAKRTTKRAEDAAYSLLGMFDVEMRANYAENDHSFIRLQELILKKNVDDSILAWNLDPSHSGVESPTTSFSLLGGFLATSPSDFANCGNVVSREDAAPTIQRFELSNGSLHLQLPLLHTTDSDQNLGLLKCRLEAEDEGRTIGIPLCRIAPGKGPNEYVRPAAARAVLVPWVPRIPTSIRIHGPLLLQDHYWCSKYRRHGFSIENSMANELELIDVHPRDHWMENNALNAFVVTGLDSRTDAVRHIWTRFRHTKSTSEDFLVELEIEMRNSQPVARISSMIASRETVLSAVANANLSKSPRLRRNNASNGLVNLRVDLAEEWHGVCPHPTYVVRLSSLVVSPELTVNVTPELGLLIEIRNLQMVFEQSLPVSARLESLAVTIQEQDVDIAHSTRQLDTLQQKIDRMELEKQRLVRGLERHKLYRDRLLLEQSDLATKEEDVLGMVSMAQMRASAEGEKETEWEQSVIDMLSNRLLTVSDNAINSMPDKSQRAFMQAIKKGNKAAMCFILGSLGSLEFEDKKGWSVLSRAIVEGRITVVSWLIEQGVSVENADSCGDRPLALAVGRGFLEAARLLLAQGAQVDIKDADGSTPLHSATQQKNVKMVQLLLEHRANPEATTKKGLTALLLSVHNDTAATAIARLLLDHEVNTEAANSQGRTALLLAAQNGATETARMLLDHRANIAATANDGTTALSLAVQYGKVDIARLLLDRGANINATMGDGWDALAWASYKGRVEFTRLLLDRGAKINATTDDGWDALTLACQKGGAEVVRLLIDRGANINSRNDKGWSALAIAVSQSREQVDVVRLLLDRGAALEPANAKDAKPLVEAAGAGHVETVRLLLDHGAALESHNGDRRTPLLSAAKSARRDVAKLLIERGSNVEANDAKHATPLILATIKGQEELVSLLVTKGANVAAKDWYHWTALHYAARDNSPEIIRFLIDKGAGVEDKVSRGHTPLYVAIRNAREAAFQTLIEKGASLNMLDKDYRTPLQYARHIVETDDKYGSRPGMKEIIQFLETSEKSAGHPVVSTSAEPPKAVSRVSIASSGFTESLKYESQVEMKDTVGSPTSSFRNSGKSMVWKAMQVIKEKFQRANDAPVPDGSHKQLSETDTDEEDDLDKKYSKEEKL
ncbi:Ankyrin-3-like protein 1 [Colletotrichum chlorophyti]|uniref:Ankyrin-3-like protein 1 n=1 Tax=Colletotrichum chlorophyti TaxID=708187 RepID=A0A1Q8S5K9_9PEZI|nr:Ankyrin-3-like protein 1 [Colletotrichum chlorophyti]